MYDLEKYLCLCSKTQLIKRISKFPRFSLENYYINIRITSYEKCIKLQEIFWDQFKMKTVAERTQKEAPNFYLGNKIIFTTSMHHRASSNLLNVWMRWFLM